MRVGEVTVTASPGSGSDRATRRTWVGRAKRRTLRFLSEPGQDWEAVTALGVDAGVTELPVGFRYQVERDGRYPGGGRGVSAAAAGSPGQPTRTTRSSSTGTCSKSSRPRPRTTTACSSALLL